MKGGVDQREKTENNHNCHCSHFLAGFSGGMSAEAPGSDGSGVCPGNTCG